MKSLTTPISSLDFLLSPLSHPRSFIQFAQFRHYALLSLFAPLLRRSVLVTACHQFPLDSETGSLHFLPCTLGGSISFFKVFPPFLSISRFLLFGCDSLPPFLGTFLSFLENLPPLLPTQSSLWAWWAATPPLFQLDIQLWQRDKHSFYWEKPQRSLYLAVNPSPLIIETHVLSLKQIPSRDGYDESGLLLL